jgi:hypothetical protein
MFGKLHPHRLSAGTLIFAVVTILTPITIYSQGLPRPTGTASKAAAPAAKAKVPLVWRDPGDVESLDLAGGAGGKEGAPVAPFTFLEENLKGTNPKLRLKTRTESSGRSNGAPKSMLRRSPPGLSGPRDTLSSQPTSFPPARSKAATGLTRAKSKVADDGSFTNARFERQKDKGVKKLDEEQSWSWVQNPFVGSKELNGLKIMVMLLSNWDNKDVRDVSRGSNTAIFQAREEDQYIVTDWGGSLGKWGNFMSREKWDCKGYQSQSKNFVKGVKNGVVEFGYSGQHTKDFGTDIKVADVQWLVGMIGKLSDKQINDALQAGGATAEEQSCYARAIRERIDALKAVK